MLWSMPRSMQDTSRIPKKCCVCMCVGTVSHSISGVLWLSRIADVEPEMLSLLPLEKNVPFSVVPAKPCPVVGFAIALNYLELSKRRNR